MKIYLKKIRSLYIINLQVSFIYKVNFIMGILSVTIMMLVHYNLWEAIYTLNDVVSINGFTFYQMIVYVILARSLNMFINSINLDNLAATIKDGSLSVYLVRPMGILSFNVASKLGTAIINVLCALFVFVLMFILMIRDFSSLPSASVLALTAIASIFGLIINILITYMFAQTAFWIEHASVVFVVKGFILSFISGVWVPLAFMPSILQNIIAVTPFRYLLSFSIEIYLGHISYIEVIYGFAIQIFWIVLLYGLSRLMWARGLKRYKSVGG